jgi:hypothetical protein
MIIIWVIVLPNTAGPRACEASYRVIVLTRLRRHIILSADREDHGQR